jgi:formyltetrahydrofolate-dependent phosphoribosylglycinamide formyltransferase
MFKKLQQKWKVNGWQLLLILCTFALGGSLCGYAGRKLLGLFTVETGWLRVVLYILIMTLIWPLCVLLISIPFGQFGFFNKYVRKIGRRLMGKKVYSEEWKMGNGQNPAAAPEIKPATRLAIFASGAGSNAQKIIEQFKTNEKVLVSLIVSNKTGAGVLKIAERENIPSLILDKEKFFRGNAYVDELREQGIDFIILAGFLWKIPSALIKVFPNKIINIHPALLPKYGGKGMYGHHVHEAVIGNKEKESGITIHYVDELYDHGSIIFQAKCAVEENDTAESLAAKIHLLEHANYPVVIERLIV